jgi:hypothetical protein
MHVPGRGSALGVAVGAWRLRPSAAMRKRLRVGVAWWTSHYAETTLAMVVLGLGVIVGLIVARL